MITAILFLTEQELTQAKRNRFRNTEVESWKSIAIRSILGDSVSSVLVWTPGLEKEFNFRVTLIKFKGLEPK
jgi:hypothetical protein